MGDPQQKVGPLEWTEKVNEKNTTKWGSPNTKDGSMDWTMMDHKFLDFWIFGLLIFWFFFFGQCPIRHPKHCLHRPERPAILQHVTVKS